MACWYTAIVRASCLLGSLVGVLTVASSALAQAWLPDRGTGSISFVTQSTSIVDHYLGSTRRDLGSIHSRDFIIDASYGLTGRFAIRFGVPFVMTKYNGTNPHTDEPGFINYDTGQYHHTWQDLRFDARYALTPDRALAVTPFLSFGLPSHDYYYYAHSAPGRDLREIQVGTYIARRLDPIAPRLFLQGRAGYGFVEHVLGFSHDRVYLDIEATYFLSQRLRLFFSSGGFVTRGGLDIPPVTPRIALIALGNDMGVGDAVWINHDRLGAETSVNIGFGGSIALTQSFDFFGSAGTNVLERNGHAVQRLLAFGVTWHFSRTAPLGVLRECQQQQMIARCACREPG